MRIYSFLVCLLLCLPIWGSAQFNFGYELRNDIPVVFDSDTLSMPWAGGLNNPQFESFDLNFDATEDLLVHEYDGGLLKCFIYDDATGEYHWEHDCAKGFPELDAHFLFMKDYNGDGKKDIFTSNSSQGWLWIYKNTSTNNSFSFELQTPGFGVRYKDKTNIFVAIPGGSIPSIIDADDDGDLDIFLLKKDPSTDLLVVPSTILFIQNQSMENFGVPDSIVFQEENACWGKFAEHPTLPGFEPFDCTTGLQQQPNGNGAQRHPGSNCLTILDLNGDDRLDALIGDTDHPAITAGLNTTDNIDAILDVPGFDLSFPSNDVAADITNLVAAYHVDVDHDGKRDLVCSPNQLETSIKKESDWYYRNYGSDANPDFELEKRGLFSSEMIEVGYRSHPAFGDVNGDGLQDLVVGNEFYNVDGVIEYARVELYLNVGTQNSPIYEHAEDDLGAALQYEWSLCHPALADLTGDGKAELIIGDNEGRLHYFENTGTGNGYSFQLTEQNFKGIDAGINAHPSFFDFNVDGLPDLMIGNALGTLLYYENNGTASIPDFSSSPTINNLGNVNLFQEFGGETTPYFTRAIDSTFGLYAFVSTLEGTILFYGPITDIGGTFEAVDSIVVSAQETSIAAADIQGDDRIELAIGQRTGGLYLLSRERNITPGMGELGQLQNDLKVYPNPASDEVEIRLEKGAQQILSVELVSMSGQRFDTNVEPSGNVKLSVEELPAGIYSVIATLDDGQQLVSKLTIY